MTTVHTARRSQIGRSSRATRIATVSPYPRKSWTSPRLVPRSLAKMAETVYANPNARRALSSAGRETCSPRVNWRHTNAAMMINSSPWLSSGAPTVWLATQPA